jgi:tetratricopeptide (TPR) repeat protein
LYQIPGSGNLFGNMTAEQWQSVEHHFAALTELPPELVGPALATIADDTVRSEVAELLRHVAGADTIAGVVAAIAWKVEDPPAPGLDADAVRRERIGPYRLVRRIGQGGQGTVFEAVRDDGTFAQQVAIKVVTWETDSEPGRERFRQERQILAGLAHPSIARLFDGGEMPGGAPYLVMEFVDGQPLTKAAQDWPLRRKLELFLAIAAGVAYAHANLIVHRDLKPGNILVTADGSPKLLDFGIAKLLDSDADVTRTAAHALTPAYASPEQILAKPVTTASDVYALGVVLYELLTGRKPYAVDTTTFSELTRAICEQPPVPSGLDEELDAVLMMALRKEPERRYAGVREFAADVQRFLDKRPVAARPDTSWYRARKYVRRHWAGVLATMLVLVAIGAGTSIALYQARLASRRFDQVRKLANRFLFDFDKEIAPIPGTVKARQMIVSTALEYLDSLEKDSRGDLQLQWELASAYAKVADVQGSNFSPSLNHPQDAAASLRKALVLARPLADDGRLSPEQKTALVSMLRNLQAIFDGIGDPNSAEQIGLEQVARSAQLPLIEQDRSAGMLGFTYMVKGDLEKARELFDKSLQISRQLAASDPSWTNRLHLASSLRQVGQVLWNLARPDEALPLLHESVALYRQCIRERPQELNVRRSLVTSLDILAQVFGSSLFPSLGRPAEAQDIYQEMIDLMEARLKADPRDRSTQHDLAAVIERAGADIAVINPEKALTFARRAVELKDASDDNLTDKVGPRIRLAEVLVALKRYGEAARRLEEDAPLLARDDYESETDMDFAWAHLEMARGNTTQAADWCSKGVSAAEKALNVKPTPSNALAIARVLELGARVQPVSAPAYRRRLIEVWQDQDRRFPGSALIRRRAVEAEKNLTAH